jgi:5-formyltetrahydrofolate cyclo-ligase
LSSPPIAELKAALRGSVLARLRQLPPADRVALSLRVAERVVALPEFARARTLALYAALPTEVEAAAIAAVAVARGKRLAYPLLAPAPERALRFAAAHPAALVPGPLRALEPPPGAAPVAPGELDLLLVPGVAFDAAGARLGRGRGHYDATLALLRPDALRVGLAFELQLVDAVPREPHDATVDAVATEARLLTPPPRSR